MKKKINRKKKPIIIILDILIVVLTVCAVGAGVFAVNMLNETYASSYDTESFYYRLNDESYAQMVEMYYSNEMADVEADEELEQYYGVAKYFEAASYYVMYQKAGDQEKVIKYQEEMAEAKEDMGELAFVSDKIMSKFAD